MVRTLTIFGGLYICAALVMVAVATGAWHNRDEPSGTPMVVMMIAGAGWAMMEGIQLLSRPPAVLWATEILRTPFAFLAAAGWFYVAVEYTGRDRLMRRPLLAVVGLVALVDLVGGLTNQIHHLYFTTASRITPAGIFEPVYGPLWFAHAMAAWLCLTGAFVFLVVQYRDAHGVYRKQSRALVAATVLGFGASILNVSGLVPVAYVDPTPFGLASGGVLMLLALFRWEYLEVVPVARQTLMETMDDAVIALDDRNRVIDINPAACELLDVTPAVVGDSAEAVFAEYPELVSAYTDKHQADRELTIEGDGRRRAFDLTISPVYSDGNTSTDHSDELAARTIVLREITDQKQRERELRRQNEQLDQFASVVSHDLRNPLGIAEMYTDFAEESGDETDFEAIREAHDRMDEMIDDLLTIARADTVVEDRESVVVAELVRDSWATAQTQGATLDIELSDEWTVAGDPDLLRNVFENLFRNAVDHNEPPVTVTVERLDDSTGFAVADDGTGIPEEQWGKVFDHGVTTNEDGTGFGLAIVSQLIEAHGWEISVTDSATGGARFEIVTGS